MFDTINTKYKIYDSWWRILKKLGKKKENILKETKLFKHNLLKRQNAFTLVELLTVLVIIGIILAITIPNVARLMYNQNDKKLHALIDSALKASDVYIDNYKKSFVDLYDKYNFQYESLLGVNYVK